MPISSAVYPSERSPAKNQIEIMIRYALDSGHVTVKDLNDLGFGFDEKQWKENGVVVISAPIATLRKAAGNLWRMMPIQSRKAFQYNYLSEAISYVEGILNNLHSDGLPMHLTRRKVLELNAAICQELRI